MKFAGIQDICRYNPQVMQMKEQLEREHERKMTEMREAARRMKDDCSHQVEIERCVNKGYFSVCFVLRRTMGL